MEFYSNKSNRGGDYPPPIAFQTNNKEIAMGRRSIILVITVAVVIIAGVIVFALFDTPSIGTPPYENQKNATLADKNSSSMEKYAIPMAQAKKVVKPIETKTSEEPEKSPPPPVPSHKEEDLNDQIRRARDLRSEPSKESIALLKEFMNGNNRTLINSALNSLAFIGCEKEFEETILNLLMDKATDLEFSQRGTALTTLALLTKDERVFPIIEDFMAQKDSTESYIRYATAALGIVATPGCVPYLEQILNQAYTPEVHKMTFQILSRIASPQSTDILSHHLVSGNEQDQIYSAWALSLSDTPRHNTILYQMLSEKQLSQKAIDAIARNSAGAKVMGELLEEETFEVKDKINILKTLDKSLSMTDGTVRSDIIESVEPLLESDNYDIQLHALKIIGHGSVGEEALDVISSKLISPSSKVRETAVEVYLPYLTESNYKPLLNLIWDENEAVRRKALLYAFVHIDNTDRPLLEKALNHEDEFIRNQISKVLN
jgi:HEAT repeat protein